MKAAEKKQKQAEGAVGKAKARAAAAAEALRGAQADFNAADAQKEALQEQVRKATPPTHPGVRDSSVD